jgi:RNA polymerase sigma-70 factor (ECF subfamily)
MKSNPAILNEQMTEEWLIEQSKSDPKNFEKLYERYFEAIFRFIYQRMDSKETTADITSQVFLKALVNLHTYFSRGIPFSAWLYRIALNEINNHYNRSKQLRVINIETVKVHELADELESDKTEEQLNSIYKSLKMLNRDDLWLIEMRFFEGRSFREIGDILSITENNAKVKLYRLLAKLKQLAGNPSSKMHKK